MCSSGSLRALAAYTKQSLAVPGDGLQTTLQPRAENGGQVAVADGGRPLLVARSLGRGWVYALGSNPAVARNCALNLYDTGTADAQRRVVWTTIMVASLN